MATALAVLLVLGGVATGIGLWSSHRSTATAVASTGTAADPTGTATAGSGSAAAGASPSTSPSPGKTLKATESGKAATAGSTGAGASVKLGVFVGTSASDVKSFGSWLGNQPVYAVDFSTRQTWSEIADPAYMIDKWRGSGYRMVYGVAMVPGDKTGTMEAGAKGSYDKYYKTLAQKLVQGGQGNAILRVGWEFNLLTSRWGTDNPATFIAYWRHIVNTMRSVPGTSKMQFDWNPNIGVTEYDASQYYPGAKYVDYIGLDAYDVSWIPDTYPYGTASSCNQECRQGRNEVVWQQLLNGTGGLAYWSDFARTKGKPISLPEWGLWDRTDGHGGGDDPYFIQQMWKFIDDPSNHVAYEAYFNLDSGGTHELTKLKKSGPVFKKLFK